MEITYNLQSLKKNWQRTHGDVTFWKSTMLLQNSWRFPKDADTCWLPQDCKKKKHGFPKQYVYLLHSTTTWNLHDFWCLTYRSITQSSGSILPTADADHLDWKTYTSRFFRAGRPAKVVAMRSRKKYSLKNGVVVKGISPRNSKGTSCCTKNCWVTNGILW